jgi:ribose/xylose/arabinose/galactoside ABC-type transport system permease subunit
MFRSRPGYIFAAVVLATVGVVHRSRVVRWVEAVGIGGGPAESMSVGWGPISFWWYVFIFSRSRISV